MDGTVIHPSPVLGESGTLCVCVCVCDGGSCGLHADRGDSVIGATTVAEVTVTALIGDDGGSGGKGEDGDHGYGRDCLP